MSIQDLIFLKNNSQKEIEKFYFSVTNTRGTLKLNNSLNNIINDENLTTKYRIIHNVFTIHILSVNVFGLQLNPYIFNIFANNIKMDAILLNQNGLIHNTIGIEYEKIIHPLCKLSEIEYNLVPLISDVFDVSNIQINGTIIIRNYKPNKIFDNVYNDLNPQYNPNVILSESESEAESED